MQVYNHRKPGEWSIKEMDKKAVNNFTITPSCSLYSFSVLKFYL